MLLAASQEPHPEGANAIVLFYQVNAHLAADGRMQRTTRTVSRILRVQGVKDVQALSAPWNTVREERPRVKARVITRDGQAHDLPQTAVHEKNVETSVEGISSPTKIVSANLTDADVDSVVETEINTSDAKPGLMAGRFGRIRIPSEFPIATLSISVSAPTDAPLRLQVRSLPSAKRTQSSQNGMRQITIEAVNLMPPVQLALAPPEVTIQPAAEFSTLASWQAVAAAYSDAVAKLVPAPAQPAAGHADQVGIVADALAQVHSHIQFSGLRWGLGAYIPNSVEEIARSKTGDPADETLLLLAELGKRGLHAVPAFITPAPAPEIVPELPGIEFESVIAYVPGPNPMWIDPSAGYTEVSRLPVADQGRWALIADAGTTHLTKTPEEPAAGNRSTDTTTIQLQDGAEPIVSREIETQGAADELLRPMLERWKTYDEKEAKSQAGKRFGIAQVETYQASDPKDVRHSSHLKIMGEGYPESHQLTDDGGFINLPGPAGLDFGKFTDLLRLASFTRDRIHTQLPPRDLDYFISPAFTEEMRYRVSPPPGYRFKEPEPLGHIDLSPLQLTSSVKLEPDGSVSLSHFLTVPKRRFSRAEGPVICDGLVKILNEKFVTLTLINIGQEQLTRGQIREGLFSLRQDAAAAPSNPAPALRLASAYVQVGSRTDAEKLCKEVIAKNPEKAEAYARLGWVYTHDEFGRAFEPGMDYRGAEDAFRKALDVEPHSKAFEVNLATLYAHNPAGVVCGPGTRFSDAIDLFNRAGLPYLASTNAVNDYAVTLLCAKRFDALRNLFLYTEAERAEPALKIAAIAATDGAQSAVQELDLSAPANAKSAMAMAAARMLLVAREYKSATNLVDALGSKAISQGWPLRLRRTTTWDAGTARDLTPVSTVKKFIAAVVNPADPQSWKKMIAPESIGIDLNRSRHLFLKLLEPEDAPLMQLPGWLNIAADELETSFQFSATGDDQSGHQVFISDPGGKPRQIASVVKRGGDYVIRSLDIESTPAPAENAAADLRALLDRGEIAEALAIERKRCADPHASAADWILDAQLALLTNADVAEVQEAAEHGLHMTHGEDAEALEILAFAQAQAGELNPALITARKLADGWGTHDQAALVFGRVAEVLNLNGARQLYEGVTKPPTGEQLSSYAIAQRRLEALRAQHW